LIEFQENERTLRSQQCGKRVDHAGTGVRGVWAAANEHLIDAYFCGDFPYFFSTVKIY
jgi:hypothetical protein